MANRIDSDENAPSLQPRVARPGVSFSGVHASGDSRQVVVGGPFNVSGDFNFGYPPQPEDRSSPDDGADRLLRSLSFDGIEDRFWTVDEAYSNASEGIQTCRWITKTEEFQRWLEREQMETHNGILFLKGKPGVGKSTLMKYTISYCIEAYKSRSMLLGHYFFSARAAGNLEKSPTGMLRSLLYQVLKQSPARLKYVLQTHHEPDAGWKWPWGLLTDCLKTALCYRPGDGNGEDDKVDGIFLFCDALDESRGEDLQRAVDFIEKSAVNCRELGIPLFVCMSSRHYPNIETRVSKMELVVEGQDGHNHDIEQYIWGCLLDPKVDLAWDLQRKSEGVFLWVVLVVNEVNRAYRQGRNRNAVLNEYPADLDDLFQVVLEQKNPRRHQTLLMLEWMVYFNHHNDFYDFGGSRSDIMVAELLYHAVLAGTEISTIERWTGSENERLRAVKFITDVSRGLLEVVKPDKVATGGSALTRQDEGTPATWMPVGRDDYATGITLRVQFVHQTVIDFLTKNKRFQMLDSESSQAGDFAGATFGRLALCCLTYVQMASVEHLTADYLEACHEEVVLNRHPLMDEFIQICKAYPFLRYALTYALRQAEQASSTGIRQDDFLDKLLANQSSNQYDTLARRLSILRDIKYDGRDNTTFARGCGLVYLLALEHRHHLLGDLFSRNRRLKLDINSTGGKHLHPLQAACIQIGEASFIPGHGQPGAACATVEILLTHGANTNAVGGYSGSALQAIAEQAGNGSAYEDECLRIMDRLMIAGADVNAVGGYYGTALQAAALFPGSLRAVKRLLAGGADVNAKCGEYGSALNATVASSHGNVEIVRELICAGAEILHEGGLENSVLCVAISRALRTPFPSEWELSTRPKAEDWPPSFESWLKIIGMMASCKTIVDAKISLVPALRTALCADLRLDHKWVLGPVVTTIVQSRTGPAFEIGVDSTDISTICRQIRHDGLKKASLRFSNHKENPKLRLGSRWDEDWDGGALWKLFILRGAGVSSAGEALQKQYHAYGWSSSIIKHYESQGLNGLNVLNEIQDGLTEPVKRGTEGHVAPDTPQPPDDFSDEDPVDDNQYAEARLSSWEILETDQDFSGVKVTEPRRDESKSVAILGFLGKFVG